MEEEDEGPPPLPPNHPPLIPTQEDKDTMEEEDEGPPPLPPNHPPLMEEEDPTQDVSHFTIGGGGGGLEGVWG